MVCRKIMETHHSTLEFDSQVGRKTTVRALLPIYHGVSRRIGGDECDLRGWPACGAAPYGCTHGERWRQQVSEGGSVIAALTEHETDGSFPYAGDRLGDRGQRWIDATRHQDVVVTDDGQVIRYAYACTMESLQGADRHQVIGNKERAR